jgi:hypothetical protein
MEYVDPVVHYDFPHLTKAQMLADLRTILVDGTPNAGWSLESSPAATATLTFTGLPATTQICTIDGKTYTFQTTLTDVNGNVKIGATAAENADNLKSAINLDGGAGTKYAASMTLHPTCSATNPTTTTVLVAYKTGGPGGNGISVSENLNNATWNRTTLQDGGYIFQPGTTADGLAYRVKMYDAASANAFITIELWSLDGTLNTSGWPLKTAAAGQRLRCIADPYGFHTYKPSNSDVNTIVHVGTLKLVGNMQSTVVSTATAASPVAITTATPHGLLTGQQIYIHNIIVVPDGLYTFTKTGDSAGTLDGTTGSGTYVSGGLIASNVTGEEQTAQLFWGLGGGGSLWGIGFRTSIASGGTSSGNQGWVCRNQLLLNSSGTDAGRPGIQGMTYNRIFRNGRFIAYDAFLYFNEQSVGATPWVQGLMFNAMVANTGTPYDELFQTPDGKWWTPFTNNGADGTLFLRVPADITTL